MEAAIPEQHQALLGLARSTFEVSFPASRPFGGDTSRTPEFAPGRPAEADLLGGGQLFGKVRIVEPPIGLRGEREDFVSQRRGQAVSWGSTPVAVDEAGSSSFSEAGGQPFGVAVTDLHRDSGLNQAKGSFDYHLQQMKALSFLLTHG